MSDANPYSGREQTEAKHFVLRTYLQALAFKVLTFSDLAYVDGFSGPWETRTEDFRDSSFMIAIAVLRDAQAKVAQASGIRRKVRCFFCERDAETFRKLEIAVSPYHKPDEDFEVQTHGGNFADAVPAIRAFIGKSFALIFIDPTGWTGYPLDVIKPLIAPRQVEVLINFMYDFINRAAAMSDPATIASLDAILGGPGWSSRLDPELAKRDRGKAVEQLFRDALKQTGNFKYVVSTVVERATMDRPHFFLTYGTKDETGLREFRETEYRVLKKHAMARSSAREREREQRSRSADMFAGVDGAVQSQRVEHAVADQGVMASDLIISLVKDAPKPFGEMWPAVIQRFVLRVTNVTDVCVQLARDRKIERTWGDRRKPSDSDLIKLVR